MNLLDNVLPLFNCGYLQRISLLHNLEQFGVFDLEAFSPFSDSAFGCMTPVLPVVPVSKEVQDVQVLIESSLL